MRFKFGFCSKGIKAIQTIKITVMLFPLIMLRVFLLEDNAIVFLRLEPLKE